MGPDTLFVQAAVNRSSECSGSSSCFNLQPQRKNGELAGQCNQKGPCFNGSFVFSHSDWQKGKGRPKSEENESGRFSSVLEGIFSVSRGVERPTGHTKRCAVVN